jgi:hypothetical protein
MGGISSPGICGGMGGTVEFAGLGMLTGLAEATTEPGSSSACGF